MKGTIKRSLVLKQWDIKEDARGREIVFSIKFIKKNGELVYLPKAVATGLKANMKKNRFRAAIEVDNNGTRYGHIYPVKIDNIVEYNGRRVVL